MALGIHINPEYSFFDGLTILAVPVFVCLFLILFLARGDIKLSLVRIGTKDIKMSSTVFPPSDDYPRLKKEGDKVYYYTYVRSENVSSPYKVKEEVQKEFDKILFGLKNQQK